MDLLDTFWMELPHARSYGGSGMFCGILSGRFIQVSGLSGAQGNGDFIFFPYACFHVVSLISIALIYRRKRFGVLLYGVTCVACVIFPWCKDLGFPMESLVFSLVCFGLFAVHLAAMKKKADESSIEEEAEAIGHSKVNQQ